MLRSLAIVCTSAIFGFAAVMLSPWAVHGQSDDRLLARARQEFSRPTGLPHPAREPPSRAIIDLGERLFSDPRLSANGSVACATCHVPALGFADGVPRSTAGITGRELRRHTPSLWNLAWSPLLYWDGRATSLEDQARFPITQSDEMASSPDEAARRLAEIIDYSAAFAAAFPGEAVITGEQILRALAAYVRTLVSPPTRFDRWLAGDAAALTAAELRGLSLFIGKARCVNCHTGFAFSDHGFHDIGLATADAGRGAIAGVARLNHAFKTPGLRELVWTAPYMHDGSKATLEDVIRHYESGGVRRPSRSRELPAAFRLTHEERGAVVAFLETLSSERPPKPSDEPWVRTAAPKPVEIAATGTIVSQKNRTFAPGWIRLTRGQTLTVLNDDTRAHNIRIEHSELKFNSGVQDPGERITLKFDKVGRFEAHCAIHPTMRLTIDVE